MGLPVTPVHWAKYKNCLCCVLNHANYSQLLRLPAKPQWVKTYLVVCILRQLLPGVVGRVRENNDGDVKMNVLNSCVDLHASINCEFHSSGHRLECIRFSCMDAWLSP